MALYVRFNKKRKQLDELEKKTAVAKQAAATIAEIEGMVKPTLLGGNLQITPRDWKSVSGFAKEGILSRATISGQKETIGKLKAETGRLKGRLAQFEGKGITDNLAYFQAKIRAPRRLAATVADIIAG